MQHECKKKPSKCEKCGSRSIATYVYGDPVDEVIKDQSRPTLEQMFEIGGCGLPDFDCMKTWRCKRCGQDYYAMDSSSFEPKD